MDREEKMKALDAALSQIERQFGKGSVMKLGDPATQMNVPNGSVSVTFFRLLPVQLMRFSVLPLPYLRRVGISMLRVPLRYSAVRVLVCNIS